MGSHGFFGGNTHRLVLHLLFAQCKATCDAGERHKKRRHDKEDAIGVDGHGEGDDEQSEPGEREEPDHEKCHIGRADRVVELQYIGHADISGAALGVQYPGRIRRRWGPRRRRQ